MSGRLKRLVLGVTLGVALLLGAAWMVFERAVYDRSGASLAAPPPPAAAVEAADAEAVVDSVEGIVQRSVKDSWAAVSAGDRLRADDSVRTGKGARAELRIGAKSRISVAQGSQLVIRELTEKVHRFKLARGHVRVDYAPDGERVLRIEGEGDGAVAETRAARFSVLSTGRSIAIATDSGAVELKAQGQEVLVEAGRQAIARSGEPPGAPQAIPTSLWLKVANALPAPPAGICAEVRGRTTAGSEVLVDGREVELAADGTFAVRVASGPDKSEVLVAIRDASGRTTTRKVPCGAEVGGVRDVALRWHAKAR